MTPKKDKTQDITGKKKESAQRKYVTAPSWEQKFPSRGGGETAAVGPAPVYTAPEKEAVPVTATLPIYQKGTYTPTAGYGAREQGMSPESMRVGLYLQEIRRRSNEEKEAGRKKDKEPSWWTDPQIDDMFSSMWGSKRTEAPAEEPYAAELPSYQQDTYDPATLLGPGSSALESARIKLYLKAIQRQNALEKRVGWKKDKEVSRGTGFSRPEEGVSSGFGGRIGGLTPAEEAAIVEYERAREAEGQDFMPSYAAASGARLPSAAAPVGSTYAASSGALKSEAGKSMGWEAPRQKQKKFKPDPDTYQRYMEYAAIPQAADFEEKSQYHSTYQPGTEEFNALIGQYIDSGYDDLTYDILNRDPKAIERGSVASYKSYNDLDDNTLKVFNYIYATKGPDAAYQYLEDMAVGERFSGIEAMALGAYHGAGLSSVSALLGKGLSAVTGDKNAEQRNKDWYGDLLRDVSQAQKQHPAAYGAGAVGGNLALLYGTGAALGAAEGALAAGVKLGGRTVAVQMAPAVQGVVNSSLSFLAANAVKNAGGVATGYMTPAEYLKGVGISGAQGLAGGLAGGLVGSGMAKVLEKSGMMNPFMEFVRQSASSFAASGANIGTGYLLSEEKPSKEQIATDLTTAFLFSLLQGGISAYRTTQAAKAQMNADLEQIMQQYGQMSQEWKTMAPEARTAMASHILQQTQSLQSSLNGRYMAGQQATVDQMNGALDAITQGMKWYLSGGQSVIALPGNIPGSGAAGVGSTGLALTSPTGGGEVAGLQRKLQVAITQGVGQVTDNTAGQPYQDPLVREIWRVFGEGRTPDGAGGPALDSVSEPDRRTELPGFGEKPGRDPLEGFKLLKDYQYPDGTLDVETAKLDYKKFLQGMPKKNKIYLEQALEAAEFEIDEDPDLIFGYDGKEDKFVYNPHSEALGYYDIGVLFTHELAHRIDRFFLRTARNARFVKAIQDAEKILDAAPGFFIEFCKKNDEEGFCSDIMSAICKDKYSFPLSRDAGYWNMITQTRETFANLFSIEAYHDAEKMEFLRRHFPELIAAFEGLDYGVYGA